ncbi:rhodanese-like domain-containing protein [Pelagibius sp.]|uniref:rhodanese-like domain-containing protein n=1 Tax=Pelagibius sp. TaxID=1931238 RepID=UPI002610B6BB|nr:rhodanese-like domain-containing protein [Pelagibius sp.]
MTPEVLKEALHGPEEIALLDVREHGQYGEGHPFYAVSCPYSRLELRIGDLVPRRTALCVLLDDGDGVAERAARRLGALGYSNVAVLQGGAAAWAATGFTLFKGVNVPSKTLGELMEAAAHPPTLSAEALHAWQREGRPVHVFDGRPFSEFHKMSIPGARCVPNGEALHRWHDLVGDPETPVVINCAGRTRGLIGVESLRRAGVPNPVYALTNGTQGWALAGLDLVRGSESRALPEGDSGTFDPQAVADGFPCPTATPEQLAAWQRDEKRNCYLFDVRSRSEYDAGHLAGAVHAPAGQLVQATDQWIAVRRARSVITDTTENGVRARFAAFWLRCMGHEAYVLRNGTAEALVSSDTERTFVPSLPAEVVEVPPETAQQHLSAGHTVAIDLRPSTAFRREAIPESCWSIRPELPGLLRAMLSAGRREVLLVADDPAVATLAAIDALEMKGITPLLLQGGFRAWRDAGLPVGARPDEPRQEEAIDYLYFVHDRHDGNAEASRRYLAWELQLVDQIDDRERAGFSLGQEEPG